MMQEAKQRKTRIITTDYVLAETATLLSARGYRRIVEPFFESVFASIACKVEWMDPVRFMQVRGFMQRHHDKSWSFTDCFSFCVMDELKLHRAMTSDHHFRQAGFEPLLV